MEDKNRHCMALPKSGSKGDRIFRKKIAEGYPVLLGGQGGGGLKTCRWKPSRGCGTGKRSVGDLRNEREGEYQEGAWVVPGRGIGNKPCLDYWVAVALATCFPYTAKSVRLRFGLGQSFSLCGPQTRTISFTWEPVTRPDSQSLGRPTKLETPGLEPKQCVPQGAFWITRIQSKIWEPLACDMILRKLALNLPLKSELLRVPKLGAKISRQKSRGKQVLSSAWLAVATWLLFVSMEIWTELPDACPKSQISCCDIKEYYLGTWSA